MVRDRLSFFFGFQHLRDYDSQPGTDPSFPRTFEQDKFLAKVTWQPAPSTRLVPSYQDEFWFNPEVPTSTKPIQATQFVKGSVPVMNFGLTHVPSGNTVWDVNVGTAYVFRRDRTHPQAIRRYRTGSTSQGISGAALRNKSAR